MGSLSRLACLLAVAAAGAAQDLVDQKTAAPITSTETSAPTEVPTSTFEPPSTTISLVPTGTPATAPPDKPSANLTSVSFSGNGCPQSTRVQFSGDLGAGLQLTVPNFTAVSRGSDFDPRKRTINCQAHLSIGAGDKGWQVSPDLIGYRGFAVLDSADTRVNFFVTSYWSQDAAATDSTQTTISNTDGRRLAKLVDTDVRHEVWSPCVTKDGGPVGILNLNFRAQAASSNATALAYFGPLEVLGRPEVEVSQTVTYKWRRCEV